MYQVLLYSYQLNLFVNNNIVMLLMNRYFPKLFNKQGVYK